MVFRPKNSSKLTTQKIAEEGSKRQACLEQSSQSKKAWQESLNRGCLNKDSSLALRHYAHLKALSSRQLKNLPASSLVHRDSALLECSSVDRNTNDPPLSLVSEDQRGGEPLSSILWEDLSRPPTDIVETPPMFLTTGEFFNLLKSDEWPKEICLRVISGELLDLLLCALCILESRHAINSHVVHAYLNNRKWAGKHANGVPAPNDESAKTQRRMSVILPSSYKCDDNFTYEKICIRLVFFDKEDLSAIPYVIPESPRSTPSGSIALVPKVRDVVHPPVSTKHCKLNTFRLPPEENVNEQDRIDMLTEELEEMRRVKSEEKPIQKETKEKEKGRERDTQKMSAKKNPENDVKKLPEDRSENIEYFADNSHFIEPGTIIGKWDLIARYVFSGLLKRLSQFNPQKDQSVECIDNLSDIMMDDEYEYGRLKLSGNEIYVTGLYYPRIQNRENIENKLQRMKLAWMQSHVRKQTVKSALHRGGNSTVSREHRNTLPPLKRLTGYKNAVGKSSSPNKRKQIGPTRAISDSDLWNQYITDQEKTEMDIALQNECERGILERLSTAISNRSEQGVGPSLKDTKNNKTRGKKNVSSNRTLNNHDINYNKISRGNIKGNSPNSFSSNTNTSELQEKAKPRHENKCKRVTFKKLNDQTKSRKLRKDIPSVPLALMRMLAQWRESIDEGVDFETVKNTKVGYAGIKNVFFEKENQLAAATTGTQNVSSNHLDFPILGDINADNQRNKKTFTTSMTSLLLHNQNFSNSSAGKVAEMPEKPSRLMSVEADTKSGLTDLPAVETESEIVKNTFPNTESRMERSYGSYATSSSESEQRPRSASQAREIRCQPYGTDCCCQECMDQDAVLDYLRLEDQLQSQIQYPLTLGRLRRTYRFLERKDFAPQLESSQVPGFKHFARWGCSTVCTEILNLINDVIIRKEILTSSQGHSYTTVTFTKADAFDKLKLY